MLIKLKDGRLMGAVLCGRTGTDGPTRTILGIDVEKSNRDLFGKPIIEEFSVEDVDCFFGSYSFAPEEYMRETLRLNRELYLSFIREPDEEKKQDSTLF